MNQIFKLFNRMGCLLPILSFVMPLLLTFKLCTGEFIPQKSCPPTQSTPWWCVLLAGIAAYMGMVAYGWLDSWFRKREQLALRQKRLAQGYDIEKHYYAPLDAQGIPREISDTIIRHVRQWCPTEDFPVEPGDGLMGVALGMQAEDVHDTIEELLQVFKRQPLTADEEESFLHPIDTLSDLARFIHEHPGKDHPS